MGVEIVRVPEDALVCRDGGIVLVGMQEVERHLNLREAFVQIDGRAVGVEPRACRDDVVLARPDRAFRSVGLVCVWRDVAQFELEEGYTRSR